MEHSVWQPSLLYTHIPYPDSGFQALKNAVKKETLMKKPVGTGGFNY
jgi:hypothetical protein